MEQSKESIESEPVSVCAERCRFLIDSELGHIILEALPLGLLVAESDTGTIVFANRAAERILCSSFVSFAAVGGGETTQSYYGGGIAYLAKDWPLAGVLKGATVREEVFHYVRGDGISRILRVSGTPLRGTRDRIIGAIMTFKDVTEAELTKIALQESEERFRILSMGTLVGVAITSGAVLSVNGKFCEMFGYDREEAVGMLPPQFHPPEARELVAHMNGACDQTPYEAVCLRKNGTRFLAEIHGQAMPYKGRRVRVTAFRDVTDVKEAGDAFRKAYSELEERVSARTAYLAKLNKALCEKVSDLEDFEHATAGRELRVIELEKEVVRLQEELARKAGGTVHKEAAGTANG